MALSDSSLLTGWSKIVGSNLLAAVPLLLANAIAARALGVSAFGQIAIVLAYAKLIDGLLNFQSVNVLTRFMTEALHDKDHAAFKGLVKAGFLIDMLTALITCAIAVSGLALFGSLIGLTTETLPYAMLFCLIIPSRLFGVTEAILRNFDRFWTIGSRQLCLATLVACGWGFAAWRGFGVGAYLLIWIGAELVANLWFITRAHGAIRANNMRGVWQANARATVKRFEGFWKMLIQTNVTFGIRILSQDADILFVGAALGPGAAGLLRVAKDIGTSIGQVGRPIIQVSSPRISQHLLSSGPRAAAQYARQIALVSAFCGMTLAVSSFWWADIALTYIYGSEYRDIGMLTAFLLLAKSTYLGGVTLLPLTIALNRAGDFLTAVLWASVLFLATMFAATPGLGLLGIALAHMMFEVSWLSYGWWRVHKAVLQAEIKTGNA